MKSVNKNKRTQSIVIQKLNISMKCFEGKKYECDAVSVNREINDGFLSAAWKKTWKFSSSKKRSETHTLLSEYIDKMEAFTLYVGQNLSTTSCLLSSTDLWSNKLMIKKNDAVAIGPYDTCSTSVFINAVRTFVAGNMCDVNLTQP